MPTWKLEIDLKQSQGTPILEAFAMQNPFKGDGQKGSTYNPKNFRRG
jgi:hypothetical protein